MLECWLYIKKMKVIIVTCAAICKAIFGIGINLIGEFFKLDSKFDGKLSNNIFGLLDKNEFFKRNSIALANKGLNFSIE